MHDSVLAAWEGFYVIVGTSAAALTGLQFVVIALVAESQLKTGTQEVAAFGTPTVVHFCFVILVSAVLAAPWPSVDEAAHVIAVAGTFGLLYAVIIWRRATRTQKYKPEMEDWIWHVILPIAAYLTLIAGGLMTPAAHVRGLFSIAAAAVLLLFIGIHNAWDTVTYIALGGGSNAQQHGGADRDQLPDQDVAGVVNAEEDARRADQHGNADQG